MRYHKSSVMFAVFLAMMTGSLLLHPSVGARDGRGATPGVDQKSSGPENEMVALRAEWVKDLRAKRLDQAVALYASDASFFDPQGGRKTGQAEIRSLFQSVMSSFNSDIQLRSIATMVSGNLAYDSGDFQETLVTIATRASAKLRGSYLMVLRRDADGHWRIVAHMWTEAPPLEH